MSMDYRGYQAPTFEGYELMFNGLYLPQYRLTGNDVHSLLLNLNGRLNNSSDQFNLEKYTHTMEGLIKAAEEVYQQTQHLYATDARQNFIALKDSVTRAFIFGVGKLPEGIVVGGGPIMGIEKYFLRDQNKMIIIPVTHRKIMGIERTERDFSQAVDAEDKDWTGFISFETLLDPLPDHLRRKIQTKED